MRVGCGVHAVKPDSCVLLRVRGGCVASVGWDAFAVACRVVGFVLDGGVMLMGVGMDLRIWVVFLGGLCVRSRGSCRAQFVSKDFKPPFQRHFVSVYFKTRLQPHHLRASLRMSAHLCP